MNCTNCGSGFNDHKIIGGTALCPKGGTTFDVEFKINPEAMDFVKANLDKTPEELASLWVEKVRNK